MKMSHVRLYSSILLVAAFSACTTPGVHKNAERGPDGTIAYPVQIESSEPGARVEVNGDYVGNTPITIKIFGDKDGTFHNFGTYEYVIKVFPVKKGQYTQTKVFRTGGWWSEEDKVPSRLYFGLNEKSEGFTIDLPQRDEN